VRGVYPKYALRTFHLDTECKHRMDEKLGALNR